jgi:hypothetical protein
LSKRMLASTKRPGSATASPSDRPLTTLGAIGDERDRTHLPGADGTHQWEHLVAIRSMSAAPHSRSFPRAILSGFLYREGARNSTIQAHVKTVGASFGTATQTTCCLAAKCSSPAKVAMQPLERLGSTWCTA